MRMQVQSLAFLSRLRIQCCFKLRCRSQLQLTSSVAVAVVVGRQLQLRFGPSLGTSICHRCSHKKRKKKMIPGTLKINENKYRFKTSILRSLAALAVLTVRATLGGSDPALLWLWCRPAAAAPIRPLAWEPPYATSAAVKKKGGGEAANPERRRALLTRWMCTTSLFMTEGPPGPKPSASTLTSTADSLSCWGWGWTSPGMSESILTLCFNPPDPGPLGQFFPPPPSMALLALHQILQSMALPHLILDRGLVNLASSLHLERELGRLFCPPPSFKLHYSHSISEQIVMVSAIEDGSSSVCDDIRQPYQPWTSYCMN